MVWHWEEFNRFFSNSPYTTVNQWKLIYIYFMSVFFYRHSQFTGQKEREGDNFCSSVQFPLAHEYSEIYFQLCMWDDYHAFLIAPLVSKPDFCSIIFTILLDCHLSDRRRNINLCLFTTLGFLLQDFDIGNWWIWTRIDYQPYITSETANQVR